MAVAADAPEKAPPPKQQVVQFHSLLALSVLQTAQTLAAAVLINEPSAQAVHTAGVPAAQSVQLEPPVHAVQEPSPEPVVCP
jgi:hypothetical protein